MTTTSAKRAQAVLAGLGLLFLAACGGSDGGSTGPDFEDPGPTGPTAQPGTLTGRLTTPSTDDAAVQFVASASGSVTISSVAAACSGCSIFAKTVSGTNVRGVIVGSFTSGQPLLSLSVSDVTNTSLFTVSVVSVASGSLEVRAPTGYTVALGS